MCSAASVHYTCKYGQTRRHPFREACPSAWQQARWLEGEVFGINAREEFALLDAFASGLSREAQNQVTLQMVDVVGLPGTSTTTLEDHSLSCLAKGLQTLATGRLGSPFAGQLPAQDSE